MTTTAQQQGKRRTIPALPPMPDLLLRELSMMQQVNGGADVWGYPEAMFFRRLEREWPGLIKIVKAHEKPLGHERQPYFGVKLTNAGRAVLVALLSESRP